MRVAWDWVQRVLLCVGVVALPFLWLGATAALGSRLVRHTTHPRPLLNGIAIGLACVLVAAMWLGRRWLVPWFRALQLPDPWVEAVPSDPNAAETTEAPESWRQRVGRKVVGRGMWWPRLAETAAYAVVLVSVFDGFTRFSTYLSGVGDAEGWAWIMWRAGREMLAGHLIPIRIPGGMHPYDINLLTGDGYLSVWLGGLLNTVMQPVLASNMLQVVAVVSALAAGRWMARSCTTDRVAMVVTACAFAASPLVVARFTGHVNLMFVFPTALVLREVVDMVRSGYQRLHWVRLALWMALSFLSSFYYLCFGSVVVAVAALFCLLHRRADRSAWLTVARVAGSFAIALVLVSPFLVARSSLVSQEDDAGAPPQPYVASDLEALSPDLLSAISPPGTESRHLPRPSIIDRNLEESTFPGWAIIAGIGGLAIVATALRPLIGTSAFAVWLLSLGPTLMQWRTIGGVLGKVPAVGTESGGFAWLPFDLLARLPLMSAIRTPGRASFAFVALGAAGLATLLGALSIRIKRPVYLAVVAVTGGLIYLAIPVPVPPLKSDPSPAVMEAMRSIASDGTQRSVLSVPDSCVQMWPTSRFEIFHRHPVVGCTWFSSGIPWYSSLGKYKSSEGWASYRCVPTAFTPTETKLGSDGGAPDPGDLREMAAELDVGWVLLSKHPVECAVDSERYAAIDSALRRNAHLVAEDLDWAVFSIDGSKP